VSECMTSKERWLAALRCQPVDRLPFWPKINASYMPYQRGAFRDMGVPELHRWIGSDQHVGGPSCVRAIRRRTSVELMEDDGMQRTVFRTPKGTLTLVKRFDPVSRSWHPVEFPVKKADDIEAMSLVFSDVRYEFDADQYERARALIRDLGEDGLAFTSLGISPLMDWIQHIAGIENGLLLLNDRRGEVESLFDQMHRATCRRAEVIADKSPYRVIYSVENTSTMLISPELFRRYCYGHLADYGRIVRSAGKLHILHMCGHLKALLPDIAALPAAGIEAFTSPPVGNTTFLDGRTACGDKCLIGGTNAALWLEDAGTIIRTIERDLDALPHHRGIVVTSAGVMPPGCSPVTIREVAEWIRSYAVTN